MIFRRKYDTAARIVPVIVIVGKPVSSSINSFMTLRNRPALRRTRRKCAAPARVDDEDEADQQLRRPPRPPRSPRPPAPLPPPPPIKCALCDESLPRQHFIADGELHDACIECRKTIPPSRKHAIDCIKTFHSECEKITLDTCITCNKRWFD